MICVALTGCQSLHPFAQRTKERIHLARDWANNGIEAFQRGKLQQAKGLFKRATQESPEDFRARANLARTMHQSGETAEAIEQMQVGVQLSGNDPKLLVELGQMYLDVDQLTPAKRQAQLAIDAEPRFAPAYQLLGRIHQSRGQYDEALACFQKAAGYAPEELDVQLDIADTYVASQQQQKALATVEYVLAQHPADSQPSSAVVAKADLLMQMKQESMAVATLERAVRDQPGSKTILVRLAEAQVQTGQLSQARLTAARGREVFPDANEFQLLDQRIAQAQQQSPQHVAGLKGF